MISKILARLIIIAVLGGLIGCNKHDMIILQGDKPDKFVVPHFTVRGGGFGNSSGFKAADQLTTLLFSKRHSEVVDRSQINAWMMTQGIENTDAFSPGAVKMLADTVNASIVILGLLESSSRRAEWPETSYHVAITLRLLSGKTGEVLKIVQIERDIKSEPHNILNSLLKKLVDQI